MPRYSIPDDFVLHLDKNFVNWSPFLLRSSKHTSRTILNYDDEVAVNITGSTKYGLPNGMDDIIFFHLLALNQITKQESKISFSSISDFTKRLNLGTKNKMRVLDSLKRLANTVFEFDKWYADGQWAYYKFSLIDTISIEPTDRDHRITITFSEGLLDNAASDLKYFCDIDLSIYKEMFPLERKLYLLAQSYVGTPLVRNLNTFCSKLGMVTEGRRPSKLKAALVDATSQLSLRLNTQFILEQQQVDGKERVYFCKH